MVNTVDNVFVSTYESILRHLAQQQPSRLRSKVTERGVDSEEHNWERLGTAEAQVKTTRLQPTPVQDWPWSRRVSVPTTYDVGDSTEQEDIVQMIIDPNSNLAQSQGYAMRRAFDDEIIAAATGTALDGLGVANPFPDAQRVFGTAVNVYDTSLNFDLVTQVTERFLDNDIDPDEPKCIVIGPVQARKLLQLTEATSSDYVYAKTLGENGFVENWMGYQWIVSTRLNHPTAPGTDIDCFAMTMKAIGMMIDRDVTSRIAEDPSISFAWRIYSFMTIGAVRVEDEHIVNLQLADTI